MRRLHQLPLVAAFLAAARFLHAAGLPPDAPSVPLPNYTTSWLGNSFGGPTWVQRYADDLCVLPDGTCILATMWDEGGHEYGFYRNGRVVGAATQTHGIYGGGRAVAASRQYLFIAQSVRHLGREETGAVWPPTGTNWFGVGRRNLDGSTAPFRGGKCQGVFLPLNAGNEKNHLDITGLAASDRLLFVANAPTGEIFVYDADTMTRTNAWPLPRAGKLSYDASDDSLWVIQNGADKTAAPVIRHFTAAGRDLATILPLPEGAVPIGLYAGKRQLLVADGGPAQQILVFGNLAGQPALMRTIGERGGIYSGQPGTVGLLRFKRPVGVGLDATGNVYVASVPSGTVLESYSPESNRNWSLHGLEFIECADVDPGSPDDVYTPAHHYRLDLSQPSGRDAAYVGYLVDPSTCPDDPRVQGYPCASVFVRRIQDRRFLFGLDMNASLLQIYRFTGRGDLTAPAGLYRPGLWSPVKNSRHPVGGWLWRDVNGDGCISANEYDTNTTNLPGCAWSIDESGGIWTAFCQWQNHVGLWIIRRLPCQGLDDVGNPIYSFKVAEDRPVPPPFDKQGPGGSGAKICRLQYVKDSDTMYVSGFTMQHQDEHRDWKTSGPVIARYDHWSTNTVKRWEIVVPWESAQVPGSHHKCPDAFSVAGQRLFNGYLANGEIRVYDSTDGLYLGSLLPGPEVDKASGWIDTMYGVRATRRTDGEYLVFAEEVWHEKVLIYRLKP